MTYSSLPVGIQRIAAEVLTAKQLEAYALAAGYGMSEERIAVRLQITRRAVRDRLVAADIKIRRHPDYPKEEAA